MARKVKVRASFSSFLTELKPRNLVLLRRHFAMMTSSVAGVENEMLELMSTLPLSAADRREFHSYREAFSEELSLLRLNRSEDAAVLIAMSLLEDAQAPHIATIIENCLPEGCSARLTSKKSGADFVVEVYLACGNLNLIRRAVHQYDTLKPKGYVYYTPAFRESLLARPVFPDDARLDWAEGVLSHDFVHYLDEKLCDIEVVELNGLWYFDVVHGGSGEQGELINERSEREDYALQRPEYDTLVFDPRTGDLMMHLQNRRSMIAACYLHVLGQIIFGVENYWAKCPKFTTSPFSQPVEYIRDKVLQLGSLRDKNPLLLRVGLYALNLSKTFAPTVAVGRQRTSRRKLSDTCCLTTDRAPEERLVEEDEVIESADLLFELGSPDHSIVRYHLTIKSDQIIPGGNAVIEGLQDWLREVGLSLLGETLEQRRARLAKNPQEPLPKKRGWERSRPLLFERVMSSHKRLPSPK